MICEERINKLFDSLEESERIRENMDKLITSLHKEIDFLKDQLRSSNLIIQQYRMVK
jgi:hypothetical protein